jgi:phosphatidate phosphatase PAH1
MPEWFGDTRRMRPLLLLLALAACSSSSETPLTHATSLDCPAPGPLPFRLSTSGFQKPVNQTLASDDPRNKDQASDTLGNPSGANATVYLADDQQPASTPVDYHGIKARTAAANGYQSTALTGENVSLWRYDASAKAWKSLGSTKTDSSGQYDLPSTGFVAANGEPVYAMLEADGSCAIHYDYLFAPGSKVVVTDIDGTLTLDDGQILSQVANLNYVPQMMGAADQLMKAWGNKGYPIVYLTARTHVLRAESRLWLDDLGFPTGPLITANGGKNDDVYKTLWLDRLVHTFGWNIVAAYGNADTDITAYMNAQIDPKHIFIVGPLAGSRGTVAIANNDFTEHINTFVAAQPSNQ